MRMDKLTIKSQEALQAAQDLATKRSHQEVRPVHLAVSILLQKEGVAPSVLRKLGAEPALIAEEADALLEGLPQVEGAGGEYLSRELRDVLAGAQAEAEGMKDEYVSVEHLLLVLSQAKETKDLFERNGAGRDALLRALSEVRGTQRVTDQNPEEKYEALKRFGRDLTDEARRSA